MKTLFFLASIAFLNAASATTKPQWSFTCRTIEMNHSYFMEINLWWPTNRHPMSGMGGVHGNMNIKGKSGDHKFLVSFWPNFSEFLITGEQNNGTQIIEYKLASDDRVLEGQKSVAATLHVKDKNFLYGKWITYQAICDAN